MIYVTQGTKFRRPFAIPNALNELRGPYSGPIVIPRSVYWATPDPIVIEASNDADLKMFYPETLGVARYKDLIQIINKEHLIRLWPNLIWDRVIRQAWESKFPELQQHA